MSSTGGYGKLEMNGGNGRSLGHRWEGREGPEGLAWWGRTSCRTHFLSYSAIVLKDVANIITLDCPVYRLIATLIPFENKRKLRYLSWAFGIFYWTRGPFYHSKAWCIQDSTEKIWVEILLWFCSRFMSKLNIYSLSMIRSILIFFMVIALWVYVIYLGVR